MGLIIPQQQRPRQQLSPEDIAWHAVYRSAQDPTAAAEVIEYFDGNPDTRKAYTALYLVAKQTVRRHEAAQQRTERIALFLTQVLNVLFVIPIRALTHVFRRGGDVAVEMMPAAHRPMSVAATEPAVKRVRKLVKKPEYAEQQTMFGQPAAVPVPVPQSAPAPEPAAVPATASRTTVEPDGKGAEAFSSISVPKAA